MKGPRSASHPTLAGRVWFHISQEKKNISLPNFSLVNSANLRFAINRPFDFWCSAFSALSLSSFFFLLFLFFFPIAGNSPRLDKTLTGKSPDST